MYRLARHFVPIRGVGGWGWQHGGVTDRRPLNATAASLLGFLHERPMTGWELVAVSQERIGAFWTLTQSQVYRELAAMAAAGLLEAGPPGPRERKPHSLTAAGRAAFADWLGREPGADQIRIPLLLTLAFADHLPPGRLAELLASRRAEHAERLARYEVARDALRGTTAARNGDAGAPRMRLVTLEYGLRHEQAVLDWFDSLPELLGS